MNDRETAAGQTRQGSGKSRDGLMLAFYGDDFTGSTDALEFLSRAGVDTVLFIAPPRPEQLTRYPGLQAVGVAGMTRSMPPRDMEKTLDPAFRALDRLGAPHIHYKICSTFDSSPETGSIGKAMEVGASVFSPSFIPLLVAAPALGRYCLFGHLFARLGTGDRGPVYRLDRHPSMSRHPVTPADESDLRIHLSRQTGIKTGLLDILQVGGERENASRELEALLRDGFKAVLFDALSQEQLPGIGELIDGYAQEGKKLFSVGSSAVEMALGNFWAEKGLVRPRREWDPPGRAEPLLVASGSCSPVTRAQIARALSQGFSGIALDARDITGEEEVRKAVEQCTPELVSLLKGGKSVILHTGTEMVPAAAPFLGSALGRLARAAAEQGLFRRMVLAGGDTSGRAARELGVESVKMIASVSAGAPLCKAFAPGSPVNGLEINFKGGQVGTEEYFEMVLQGRSVG